MDKKTVSSDVTECDNSVEHTQECLDRVIPRLFDYAVSLIPKKRLQIVLSSRYNGGLIPCQTGRTRGTYQFFADDKGVEKLEARNGGKQKGTYTHTETVTRDRFIDWVAMSVERSLDVYRHLKAYIHSPARPELPGDGKPMDDLL